MKIDSYALVARYAPTSITILPPLVVCNYFFLNKETLVFLEKLAEIKIVAGLSISVALLFFLTQMSRYIAKTFFEKRIFRDGLYMPTTSFLTYEDETYSPQHKKKIRAKLELYTENKLPQKKDEELDIIKCRKRIKEAVDSVQKYVRKSEFLLRHNKEYGFARNLVGGTVPAMFVIIISGIIFGNNDPSSVVFSISAFLFCANFFVFCLGSKIISGYGRLYAKVFFQEFLNLPARPPS